MLPAHLVDYQSIMKQLPCLVASGLIVAKVCCCLRDSCVSLLIQVHRGSLQFYSYGGMIVFDVFPHAGQQSFPSFSAMIVQQNCGCLMQLLFQIYWIRIYTTAI